MRINPKVYSIADEDTPIEVQEFDGRRIEVFHLDNYEDVKMEFINQGKFAVWSSIDGVNYRVFIESGYYEELKVLYSQPVNKIWVDFWDTCESVSKKMSGRIILPLTIVAVALCIGVSFIPGDYSMYIMFGVVATSIIAMFFVNRLTKKKIYDANVSSIETIKKIVGGAKKFDEILDKQKTYMESYYDKLYPQEDEEEIEDTNGQIESGQNEQDNKIIEEKKDEENE